MEPTTIKDSDRPEVEITEEMLKAGFPHLIDYHYGEDSPNDALIRIFSAMEVARLKNIGK